MRIAFFGDIVGRSGLDAVNSYISRNKEVIGIDCAIVNAENAAGGFGITQPICDSLFKAGIDAITLGNHTFDQKDDLQIFDRAKNIIRPLNYPKGTPGHGYYVHSIPKTGKKLMIINIIGRLFMEPNDDPFSVISDFLKIHPIGVFADAIFVDVHAEATAEKVAIARYLDGRVSCIAGTHTHVPTSDLQILSKGTGFISDVGMCGDYNSVIGMQEEAPIKRFTEKVNAFARMKPAAGEATVCGIIFDVDDAGSCQAIQTIKEGGCLLEQKSFAWRG